MEAQSISQRIGIGSCSPFADHLPAPEAAEPGLVRVCCAVTRLVQGLSCGIPLAGQDLMPPLNSCHSDASRNKESSWDSGCGAP